MYPFLARAWFGAQCGQLRKIKKQNEKTKMLFIKNNKHIDCVEGVVWGPNKYQKMLTK
jgi:hypothetical protein